MKKALLLLVASSLATVSATQAVTVSFSAGSNGFGDVTGAGLSNVLVEIGNYTVGDVGTFSLFSGGSGQLDGFGAGFDGLGNAILTDNLALSAGSQIAVRVWDTSDTSGDVVHFVSEANWLTIAGSGTATDTSTIILNLGDLTNVANDTILPSAIIEVGAGTLAGNNGLGNPNFVSAVPEPSAFALLVGCFGFSWMLLRRRI